MSITLEVVTPGRYEFQVGTDWGRGGAAALIDNSDGSILDERVITDDIWWAYDWNDPDFNPVYHTTLDRSHLIREDFMVGNTQIAVAAVATLARLSPPIASETTSFGAFKTRFKGN